MQKILYVEDDLSLIDGLKYTLENSGYFVDNARTASEALARFKQDTYDLLLLDVTLPDGTGFDVCKEVRAISTIPIIFLTASDQEISIVRGLDIGADDYITKPFKLNELLSRIKAILRRSLQFSKAAAVLEANGIRIDTAERRVWKNGKSLDRHWSSKNYCACSCKIQTTFCPVNLFLIECGTGMETLWMITPCPSISAGCGTKLRTPPISPSFY